MMENSKVIVKTEKLIEEDEYEQLVVCDPHEMDAHFQTVPTIKSDPIKEDNGPNNIYYEMLEKGSLNYPEDISFYDQPETINMNVLWQKIKDLQEENRKLHIAHHLVMKEVKKESQTMIKAQYFVLKEIVKLREEGWGPNKAMKRSNEEELIKELKLKRLAAMSTNVENENLPLDLNENDETNADLKSENNDILDSDSFMHFMDYPEIDTEVEDGLFKLPCNTATEFEDLEERVKSDFQYEIYLSKIFNKAEERDLRGFLACNLIKLLTDDASFNFSWHGQQGNVPLKNYHIIRILKECAMKKYEAISEKLFIDTTKKCFENRKDRVRKDRYRKANRLKKDLLDEHNKTGPLEDTGSTLPKLMRLVNAFGKDHIPAPNVTVRPDNSFDPGSSDSSSLSANLAASSSAVLNVQTPPSSVLVPTIKTEYTSPPPEPDNNYSSLLNQYSASNYRNPPTANPHRFPSPQYSRTTPQFPFMQSQFFRGNNQSNPYGDYRTPVTQFIRGIPDYSPQTGIYSSILNDFHPT